MHVIASITFVFLFLTSNGNAECTSSYSFFRNNYFSASDDEVVINVAEERCSSSGGRLVIGSNEEIRREFITLLRNKFNSWRLGRLWPFSALQESEYRYRFSDIAYRRGYKPINRIPWTEWDVIELSLLLYLEPFASFNKPIWIGENEDWNKYVIVYGNYPETGVTLEFGGEQVGPWHRRYLRYGGDERTANTRRIYMYHHPGVWSTTVSLSSTPPTENLTSAGVLYNPDYWVFVGARSDAHTTEWTWNDGSKVDIPDFKPSNRDVCEVLTYHFISEWVAIALDCLGTPAFYVCQYDISVRIEVDGCNGDIPYFPCSYPMLNNKNFEDLVPLQATSEQSYDRDINSTTVQIINLQQMNDSFVRCETFRIMIEIQTASTSDSAGNSQSATDKIKRLENCITERFEVDREIIVRYEQFAGSALNKNDKDGSGGPLSTSFKGTTDFPPDSKITFMVLIAKGRYTPPNLLEAYCVVQLPHPEGNVAELVATAGGSLFGLLALVGIAAGILYIYKRRKGAANNRNNQTSNVKGNVLTNDKQKGVEAPQQGTVKNTDKNYLNTGNIGDKTGERSQKGEGTNKETFLQGITSKVGGLLKIPNVAGIIGGNKQNDGKNKNTATPQKGIIPQLFKS